MLTKKILFPDIMTRKVVFVVFFHEWKEWKNAIQLFTLKFQFYQLLLWKKKYLHNSKSLRVTVRRRASQLIDHPRFSQETKYLFKLFSFHASKFQFVTKNELIIFCTARESFRVKVNRRPSELFDQYKKILELSPNQRTFHTIRQSWFT